MAAGLLDGHVVTTFPGDQDRFEETFPELTLRREPGFVHDGKVMTSQGGAKSYDVAIYNHSPVDSLRLGALLDADLGDLNGRGSCSVPQVVQAMAVYRCSFTDNLGSG